MSSSIRSAESSRAGTGLSHDDCFDLLSNHRRRYLLHYLQQHGGEATLGELADYIAAWENDIGADEVSYDERKRVYTSLQQVHVPRMEEMGVVEFDDRASVVELGSAADNLDDYLEVTKDDDVPWSTVYLTLALVNGALLGVAVLGVVPLSLVPPRWWAVWAVATFLLVSSVHAYLDRTGMEFGTNGRPPGQDEN